MKTLWVKTGCYLTGWNPKILNSCTEASFKQLKKYTSALFILIILWAFIGYSFVERYVHTPWWGCLIAAFISVLIIIQIERQIILTVGKNKALGIFRVVIAFIMATIGSTIIDQIIFKDDIEKKMIEIDDRKAEELLPKHLEMIESRLKKLQTEKDSLEKKNSDLNSEISKQPIIQTVSTIRTPTSVRQPDGADKIVYTTTVSTTPIPNPKITERDVNNQTLDTLRKKVDDYTREKINIKKSLLEELKSKKGFLGELDAIIEILRESTTALIFYLILFGFLMSLELFVVVSKIGDKKSDYDLVVEYQLEQKKKTLKGLANE
jgi:hypothetical protein